MNNGKICISICAETADDLIAQIKRAEDLADVIEIRFDCLNEREFDSALQKVSVLNHQKPLLATLRPKHQKAGFFLTRPIFKDKTEKKQIEKATDYRISGWEKIAFLKNIKIIDFEADILMFLILPNGDDSPLFELSIFSPETQQKIFERQIIFSEHYFDGVPNNLEQIYQTMLTKEYEKLNGKRNDIIKIAIQSNNITNIIEVWKLLEKAKLDKKQIIPIAMGESGKWTRILGLAHGAFMTYAALESNKETAPGQISAKDLIEVYRVKELNEETEIYGIIGGNTSYSMSPFMHNAAFKFHGLNAVFVPLQTQNLDEFIRRMVRPETREINLNFKGFAVTIPHKQAIIKHLDFLDETARKIGAVNTVKIIDGKLYGYNTDAKGFIEPLLSSYGDLRGANVALFGAGGAARACVYALKHAGAKVTIFARNFEKAKILAEEFQITDYKLQKPKAKNQKPKTNYNDFDILVNATPLGTKGEFENESIATAEQIEKVNLIYDLVYNPFQTKLLKEADRANVPVIGGMAMLVAQAIEQQKIWTGFDAPMKQMSAAVLKRLA